MGIAVDGGSEEQRRTRRNPKGALTEPIFASDLHVTLTIAPTYHPATTSPRPTR